MALLLAMYQKMRLIREKNQATLDLTKFSSKYDRVSKNIERVQKMYTSRIAKLEGQANNYRNNAAAFFRSVFHLGTNDFNLNPYSYGGLNGYNSNVIMEMMKKGGYKNPNDKDATPLAGLPEDRIRAMMLEYNRNRGSFELKKDPNDETKYLDEYKNWSKAEVEAFMVAKQQGDYALSTAQNNCTNITQEYQNNVSIWLEAEKERLEAEQDAALEPLNYQQTMWELEKEQAEQKLQRIKAELESYTQLCSEEAKEQAPKFGLG